MNYGPLGRMEVEQGSLTCSVATLEDTLQHSRERIARRWPALREAFAAAPLQSWSAKDATQESASVCGIFSLTGGVGKTSLTAALGQVLSAAGEAVLLAEVGTHGLLPFHFQASAKSRKGQPLNGLEQLASKQPSILSYPHTVQDAAGQQALLAEELDNRHRLGERVIVDLCSAAPWALRLLVQRGALLLVPIAPDMTSVLRLRALERYLRDLGGELRRPVHVHYLLNQFEAHLPLHLDVREALRTLLGDSLLPFAIRRSSAVAEALAEATTVLEYAPESDIAADYRVLAAWLRSRPAGEGALFRRSDRSTL